jgi:hypothetical protein
MSNSHVTVPPLLTTPGEQRNDDAEPSNWDGAALGVAAL